MNDTTQSRSLEDEREFEDSPAWSVRPVRVTLKTLYVVRV